MREAIANQSRPYGTIEQTMKRFCAVRASLEYNTPEFRLAYTKPLKFYFYHTITEAIEILKKEGNDEKRTYRA